jgi:hypothetical protein
MLDDAKNDNSANDSFAEGKGHSFNDYSCSVLQDVEIHRSSSRKAR